MNRCSRIPFARGFGPRKMCRERAPEFIRVQYDEAHFRCAQDVEGVFKEVGETLHVLVQPSPVQVGSELVTVE